MRVRDNLIKAELVTADGRQVVASESENPDLLWALRGGGGNFGVVTAFHFGLHQIGPILLTGILGYPAETAAWSIHYLSIWPDPAQNEANIAHTRAMSTSMKPWSTGGVYLNFLGDEGSARVTAAFGPERYARLQAIKAAWDPTNIFRHNQNIAPNPASN